MYNKQTNKKNKVMKTLELAKARIEMMNFRSMSRTELATLEPVVKKQGATYILQNAETGRWVAISDEEATELGNMVAEKQYGKNWRSFLLGF